MTTFALVDAAIHVGGHDFSCDTNNVSLEHEVEVLDNTTFCSDGTRSRQGGLKSTAFTASGFWTAGVNEVDADAFNNLTTLRPVTIGPTKTDGDVAYLMRHRLFSYTVSGSVGDLLQFSVDGQSSDGVGLVRGVQLAGKQDVSSTGALTGFEVGAVASGQTLYVATHVLSAGTTITFDIESDSSGAFASPTTVATIGALTTEDGTWTTVAGPITDTFLRVNVTAVTGTFSMAVAAGIA